MGTASDAVRGDFQERLVWCGHVKWGEVLEENDCYRNIDSLRSTCKPLSFLLILYPHHFVIHSVHMSKRLYRDENRSDRSLGATRRSPRNFDPTPFTPPGRPVARALSPPPPKLKRPTPIPVLTTWKIHEVNSPSGKICDVSGVGSKTPKEFSSPAEELENLKNVAWSSPYPILHDLVPLLSELSDLTGMNEFKKIVVELVTYHTLGLGVTAHGDTVSSSEGEFENMVVSGPPGTGKSMIVGVFARIFFLLGVVAREKVVMAGRGSFIGPYIGQSERNTTQILTSTRDCVLFIDESHGMGQKENPESFSQAVGDIICQELSEHRRGRVVILGGYAGAIQDRFFSLNAGLSSRFPETKRITLVGYTSAEMLRIVLKKLDAGGWTYPSELLSRKPPVTLPQKLFPSFARDLENFVVVVKSVYAKRAFLERFCGGGPSSKTLRRLELSDFTAALKIVETVIVKKEVMPDSIKSLYS